VFGRKSKQPISPMGASLRFQLNSSTLSDISATGSTPSISRMSSAWSSRNHVGIETSILVINCIDETPLFVSNGAVYADLPIEMNIPFPIGRRKVQCLSLAKDRHSSLPVSASRCSVVGPVCERIWQRKRRYVRRAPRRTDIRGPGRRRVSGSFESREKMVQLRKHCCKGHGNALRCRCTSNQFRWSISRRSTLGL